MAEVSKATSSARPAAFPIIAVDCPIWFSGQQVATIARDAARGPLARLCPTTAVLVVTTLAQKEATVEGN